MNAGPVVGVPTVRRVVVLPLTVKLRALQGAEETCAARVAACEGYAVWDEDGIAPPVPPEPTVVAPMSGWPIVADDSTGQRDSLGDDLRCAACGDRPDH